MIKAVLFDMFETQATIFQSPLYLSRDMARDAGILEDSFIRLWQSLDDERILGHISLDEAVGIVLRENDCFSQDVLSSIVNRRIDSKRECFNHLHSEIIPLLEKLKENKIKIGVVSNCFQEEAQVIRESALFQYYDAICLSCEVGLKKPDKRIFERCISILSVAPGECLYIGDGGSFELETASSMGMITFQAMWYVNAVDRHPSKRNRIFDMLERPLDVLDVVVEYND